MERPTDRRGDARLTLAIHQHERRPAPAGAAQARAERAGAFGRGHDEVELRRAALIQATAGLVRLVQQLAELF